MKKYSISCLLAIILVLANCKKLDLDVVENLNNGKIDAVGHGGMGFQSLINPIPTNSFASIRKAVEGLNADGVEIDVVLSRDCTLIVYHDQLLEHSTQCAGCAFSLDSAELIKCVYKNYYGSRADEDEYVITFRRLISHFSKMKVKPIIYVNTKIYENCVKTISLDNYVDVLGKELSEVIKEYNAYDWAYVYDGNVEFLNMLHAYDPNIILYYNGQKFDESYEACTANNFAGVVIASEDITKEQVRQFHDKGIRVVIWQMRDRKGTIDAIKKFPDGLMTDNLPVLLNILER